MSEEIVKVTLTRNPKKFIYDGKEFWTIYCASDDWLKRFPNDTEWYVAVTKKICPEVENLKKGDKILVTRRNSTIVKVERQKKKEILTIKGINTGDVWECPICHRKYHLIHRERSDGKVLKHDFEEVVE